MSTKNFKAGQQEKYTVNANSQRDKSRFVTQSFPPQLSKVPSNETMRTEISHKLFVFSAPPTPPPHECAIQQHTSLGEKFAFCFPNSPGWACVFPQHIVSSHLVLLY